MYKKAGVREVKKYLDQLEKKELIEFITDLYKENTSLQQQLTMRIQPQSINEVAQIYKDNICRSIWSRYIDLKSARAYVSDFKKICSDDTAILDVMLYYVESCVGLSDEYGDINAAFYNSLISMFYSFTELLNKQTDSEIFYSLKPRIKKILSVTSNFGWGVYDELINAYYSIDLASENDDEE